MSNDPVKDAELPVVDATQSVITLTRIEDAKDVPLLRVLHIPAVESEAAQRVVREFQEKFGTGQIKSLQLIMQPPASAEVIQPATRQTPRERFIAAIEQRRYLEIGYVPTSGDARHAIVIPLDFGPSRKAADKSDRYHMWDVRRNHVLSILPSQLRFMEEPETEPEHATFDPETVVTWCTKKSPWFIAREWGSKS